MALLSQLSQKIILDLDVFDMLPILLLMSDTPLTPLLLPPMATGVARLAPPPAPPARSPSTELTSRIPPPPPPPPLPPSSLRNGHLHNLGECSLQLYISDILEYV